MRLLFVHEINWRSKVVYETHEFPEFLALRGHEVVYIDFPEGERRSGMRRLLDLKTTVARDVSRAQAGARVEVRTPGRVMGPPLDRLLASVTHVPVVWRALAGERFDAVVLYAIPTNGWQTVLIARRFGVPVLFRAIDIPDQMRRTWFNPLVSLATKFVYRHVDAISTHTEPLRRYCIRLGAKPEIVSIEYPGFDLERFRPGPRDPELCARYRIRPEHKIAVFMGEFHYFSAVDWLIEASAPMLRNNPDFRLLLMGSKPAVGGTDAQTLAALAQRLGIAASVILTGRIEYEHLGSHLRLANLAVVPLRKTLQARTALPSKALQYLACGLPTISTPLEGLQSMVAGEEQGILYRDMDASFIRGMEDVLMNEDRRRTMASSARAAAQRLCSWDHCIEAFEAAIRRAIERRKVVSDRNGDESDERSGRRLSGDPS